MDDAIGFATGFVLGALIGGAVGLLLAPKSGPETRKAIRERANLIVEEGRRAAEERRAELEAQFAQAKSVQRTPAA